MIEHERHRLSAALLPAAASLALTLPDSAHAVQTAVVEHHRRRVALLGVGRLRGELFVVVHPRRLSTYRITDRQTNRQSDKLKNNRVKEKTEDAAWLVSQMRCLA